MIIDNRFILPAGAVMNTNAGYCGESAILTHTQDLRFHRQTALTGLNLANFISRKQDSEFKVGLAMVRDVASAEPSGEVFADAYKPSMLQSLQDNLERNAPIVCNRENEFKRSETVVIIASGNVPEKDLALVVAQQSSGNCQIITISRAISYCVPDYHVHAEHVAGGSVYGIDNLDVSSVALYVSVRSNPDIIRYGWKSTTWFTHVKDKRLDGIPLHFATESVAGDALQLAIRQLGANKIILLGFEGDVDHDTSMHYWAGLGIQAMCYWYSRAGARIWNCSKPTTLLAGVLLGKVEDAFLNDLPPLVLLPSENPKGGKENGKKN